MVIVFFSFEQFPITCFSTFFANHNYLRIEDTVKKISSNLQNLETANQHQEKSPFIVLNSWIPTLNFMTSLYFFDYDPQLYDCNLVVSLSDGNLPVVGESESVQYLQGYVI